MRLGDIKRYIIANMLPEDLFTADISLDRTKELYKDHVMVTEIENHNYCNRTCWFCPNSFLDRLSTNIIMSDNVFNKILNGLKEIDYQNVVLWSYYHEPLANDSIFERIHKMREALPKAFLKIFTNGDYLNPEKIQCLKDAGLDRMRVSLYLPDGQEQNKEVIEAELNKFEKRTGLVCRQITPGYYELDLAPFAATLYTPDYYSNYMSSRAGSLKVEKPNRTAVCLRPVTHVVVDYKGNSMLCCETRADVPSHKKAVFGNLNDDDFGLFEFYRSMASARKHLIQTGEKGGVCSKCDVDAVGNYRRHQKPSKAMGAIPGLQRGFNNYFFGNFAQKSRL